MNVVYFLINERTGKKYIGSTGELPKRIDRHFRDLGKGIHHCKPLQEAYQNGDILKIGFVVLATREEAYSLEEELLKYYQDKEPGIYNIGLSARGGDTLTRNPDRDQIVSRIKHTMNLTISKLTEAERKLKYAKYGEKNGMYGRTHTPEVRKFLSENAKGRSPVQKGVPMPPEQYKKLMAYMESRDYYGDKNPFYGKKHTAETLAKLSKKLKGLKPPNITKVLIDGKVYESMTAASKELNVPLATVHYRIKSKNPKFSEWSFA